MENFFFSLSTLKNYKFSIKHILDVNQIFYTNFIKVKIPSFTKIHLYINRMVIMVKNKANCCFIEIFSITVQAYT